MRARRVPGVRSTVWPPVAPMVAALVALGTAVTAAANCFVSGFEFEQRGPAAGAGGAAGSGGEPTGGGGQPGCNHATWPDPPTTPDPGPDDVDLVVAVRAVQFGEENLEQGPKIGYDLDERCTCQGQGDSCNEPAWATADHCDGPQGRDNAASQLFKLVSTFDDESSEAWTEQIENGEWSILVRVREYNGQANDAQVELALYPSPGLDQDPCHEPGAVPRWDGTDRWPVSATALEPTGAGGQGGQGGCGGASHRYGYDVDAPRYVDGNAYVTDGVVVGNLPDGVELVLDRGESHTVLKLTAGFLTGHLEKHSSTGRWELRDGLLVGRWKMTDFFTTISNLVAIGGVPMCTDSDIYQVLKGYACQYVDIVSRITGPTAPCDSISFGVELQAVPALIGAVDPSVAPESPCPPETNPANDDCGLGGGGSGP